MATNEEIRAKDILPHKTSFSTGDGFYGDGPQSFFMEAEDLLELTAENALSKLLPEFDPNKAVNPDTGFAYNAGESVIYNGLIKQFVQGHSGAWDNSHAITVMLPSVFYTSEVTQQLLGNRLDNSAFSKPGVYLGEGGLKTYASTFGESGKSPCIPGEYLSFYSPSQAKVNQKWSPIIFYDADGNYVTWTISSAAVLRQLVPAGCFYFSIPIKWTDGVPDPVVAAGYLPSHFIPYSAPSSKIKSVVDSIYLEKNVFNPSDATIGQGFISSIADGQEVWTIYSDFCESDFIDVRGRCLFVWYETNVDHTAVPNFTYACYDSDKNPLHTTVVGRATQYMLAISDANTAYVRIPVRESELNKVALGYAPFTRFVPFGYSSKPVLDMDIAQELGDSQTKVVSQKLLKDELARIPYSDVTQWSGKKWYAYGTSITDTTPTGKYAPYLAQMSGMTLTDKGIGGGGIGDLGGYSRGQVFNVICNTTDGKTEADLITLETGANDTGADVPLGTIYDTTQATLAGCLNICLRYLQTNTNAQIAVMPSVATTTEPAALNKYYEWQLMIRDICTINRVYFIEPACNLGYGKLTGPNGTLYRVDNIHQTNLGGYILAEAMWAQIRNIPLFRTSLPSP